MRPKKKRKPGVQVKKYQFGGSVTGPMLMPTDNTRVEMPELRPVMPQLDPLMMDLLTNPRQTGTTIGPTTKARMDADRKRTEAIERRREAIERGINPNLAFMMPPGLMGDPQAAAAYQYDNPMSSPIGQIATAIAFSPIDIGIEAAMPFIPSTYVGRQLNRFGEYVSTKAGQLGDNFVQRFSEPAPLNPSAQPLDGAVNQDALAALNQSQYVQRTEPEVLTGTVDLQATNQIGRDQVDQHIARQQEFLTDPVLQQRQRERIAEQTQAFYDDFMASQRKTNPNASFQEIQRQLRSTGPDPSGYDMGAAIADDLLRIQGAMVNGKVDPNSLLITEGLQKVNQRVQQTRLTYENLGGRRQPLDANQIAARQRTIADKKKEIRRLEQQYRREKAQQFGDPDQTRMQRDALEQEINVLQAEVEASTTGFLDPNAHYDYYNKEIYLGGQRIIDPQTGRIVREHEFEHALQRFPDDLLKSPLTQSHLMEEFDQVAARLGEMVPRKINVRTTGFDETDKFDDALKYFERTKGGDPLPTNHPGSLLTPGGVYPDRVIERTPMLAELKQDMIDKGVIAARSTEVTESDILRFLDEFYSPEKSRKFADQAIMSDPTSLRILELFDPAAKNARGVSNARIMAEEMNRLSAVILGTGSITAAGAASSYKHGGKFKILKKK